MLLLSGATVSVTGPGGFSGSAVTDANGVASFSITATGTYSYTVSKSRFDPIIGSVAVGTCSNKSVGVTLSKSDSYVCCNACPDPIRDTLTGTFTGGTVTLNYDAGFAAWIGTATVSNGTTFSCTSCSPSLCTVGAGDVTITFTLTCPPTIGGSWDITMSAGGIVRNAALCPPGGVSGYLNTSCDGCPLPTVSTNGSGTNPCGVPLALTYTINSPGTYSLGGTPFTLAFPITGTLAISE